MTKVNTTDFVRKLDALTKAYKNIPTEVATIAVNFSKDRFRNSNWLDDDREKWQKLKHPRTGKTGKPSNNQTLLVKTGRLKRSIRKISATEDKVIIGTDVPYAQIHNEGGTITGAAIVKTHAVKSHTRTRKGRKETVKAHIVKAHSRKMNVKIPKRQFMGNSYTLQKRITLHITARFTRALKS
jgi:phage gpG-like protein